MNEESRIVVKKERFLAGLRLVGHATAKDSPRPILMGVSIQSKKDGTIDIVACDGFRIAVFNMPAIIIKGKFVAVFPKILLLQLLRKIPEEQLTIDIPRQVGLGFGAGINGKEINLIFGDYPVYQGLIPTEFTNQATFLPKELKVALREIKIVVKKPRTGVRLETRETGTMGTIMIWAQGDDGKIAEREIPAKIKNPGKVAFTWEYLRDAINAGPDTIKFNGMYSRKCLFCGREGLIEVVQPLFTSWRKE